MLDQQGQCHRELIRNAQPQPHPRWEPETPGRGLFFRDALDDLNQCFKGKYAHKHLSKTSIDGSVLPEKCNFEVFF